MRKIGIKISFTFGLVFLLSYGFSNPVDLQFIRKQFFKAIEDEDIAKEMVEKINTIPDKTPTLLGFQGGFEYLMAKHLGNPYKKLDYLNKAEKTLKLAISKEPENPEIRFLRFSSQHYLPEFLGMSKELKLDRLVMVRNLPAFAKDPQNKLAAEVIARFLVQSNRCTPEELAIVKQCIPK
jgi:hypothetical protein